MKILNVKLADKGYYINLDSSVDRKSYIEEQIKTYKIKNLSRFPALTDELIQYSCTKSHLKIFELALEQDFEIIFVAEDDMRIIKDPVVPVISTQYTLRKHLYNIKKQLSTIEWDVLLLGCNPQSFLIPISNNLARVDKSTGAWAYLIKKRAYKFILENLNYRRDYIAIDDFLPLLNSKGFTTLTTIPILIHHAVGFESTLQPRGPVNYDAWIEGNYEKFLYAKYPTGDFMNNTVEKQLTVVVAGHFVDKYPFYLDHLMRSLSPSLHGCKFLIHYDYDSDQYDPRALVGYFKDMYGHLNVELSFGYGGLISTFNTILEKIRTPYFLFLEHDWVFLQNNIDFLKTVEVFDNHSFVNAVWFSKDDNVMRGFEISRDIDNMDTPFAKEDRISELDLVTTCRWSNNPVIFRTSKMKEWYANIIKNDYVGKTHQGQHNVEETMISTYREEISKNKWIDIRDNWGTFLYGSLGEGPFVGHTDASRRYLTTSRSQPEINGDAYMEQHPMSDHVKDYFKIFDIQL